MIKITTGPSNARHGELTLVQINLTQGNRRSVENIWARPLGDDLYEIVGPVHSVAGLNPGDVVRANTLPGDPVPSISEVVGRSGYTTLHVAFSEAVPVEEQHALLAALGRWRATHEMAFERFYTIVVDPEGDSQAVCDFLKASSGKGVLKFEPEIDISALYRYRFSAPQT